MQIHIPQENNMEKCDSEITGQTEAYSEGAVVEVVDGQILLPLIHSFYRQHTVSQVLISS